MSLSSSSQEPNPKKRRADGEQDDGGVARAVLVDEKTVLVDGAKAFILKGLGKYNKGFWDDLPSEWKKDRDVARAAVLGGQTTLDKLPVDLQNDRDFLIAAVNENSSLWSSLSPALKNDIDFARSIAIYTDLSTLYNILEKFPILASERNTWMAIFGSVDQYGYVSR